MEQEQSAVYTRQPEPFLIFKTSFSSRSAAVEIISDILRLSPNVF